MKVSYASCTQEQFNQLKADHFLVPGRLYWLSDTGKIMRANSESSCTSYSDQIHLVDAYPADGIEGHLYVSSSSGRAKIYQNGVYITLTGEGGGSGGSGSIDLDDVWRVLNNKLDKTALQWKQFS